MAAKSSQSILSGSYNHVGVDYISPKTTSQNIEFHTNKTDNLSTLVLDNTAREVRPYLLGERAAGEGVNVADVLVLAATLKLKVTTVTGNTTLTNGNCVVFCNNSSACTITLPTAVAGEVVIVVKVGSNTAIVTIAASSGDTISGNHDNKLYVLNDALGFIPIDATTQYTFLEALKPHYCTLWCTAAQSINSGSVTQVQFDAAPVNVGSIADVASNQVTILRPGNYRMYGDVRLAALADGKQLSAYIYAAGSEIRRATIGAPVAMDISSQVYTLRALSAADTVQIHAEHDHGSARSLIANASRRSTLVVEEVR